MRRWQKTSHRSEIFKFGVLAFMIGWAVPGLFAQPEGLSYDWNSGTGEFSIQFKFDKNASQEDLQTIIDSETKACLMEFMVGQLGSNIQSEIQRLDNSIDRSLWKRVGWGRRDDKNKEDVVAFLKLRYLSLIELGPKIQPIIDEKLAEADYQKAQSRWSFIKKKEYYTATVNGLDQPAMDELLEEIGPLYFNYITHYDSLKKSYDLIQKYFGDNERNAFRQAVSSDLSQARSFADEQAITLRPENIYISCEKGGFSKGEADELIMEYARHVGQLIKDGLTEIVGIQVNVSEPELEEPEVKNDRFDLTVDIDGMPNPEFVQAIQDGHLALWSEERGRPVTNLLFSTRKDAHRLTIFTVNLALQTPMLLEQEGNKFSGYRIGFEEGYTQLDPNLKNPRVSNLEEWQNPYSTNFFFTVNQFPGNLGSYLYSVDFLSKLKPDEELGMRFEENGVEIYGINENDFWIIPHSRYGAAEIEHFYRVRIAGQDIPPSKWYHSNNAQFPKNQLDQVEMSKSAERRKIKYRSDAWIKMLDATSPATWKDTEQSGNSFDDTIGVPIDFDWFFIKAEPLDGGQPLYWFSYRGKPIQLRR